MRICVVKAMCTNTQMFTFCTYAMDFNSFKLFMNDSLAFKYQPIKIKHMRNGVFFIYQAIDVYINYLCCEYQLIWTLHEWFIGSLVIANQIQAPMHARAGWHFSMYQSIAVYIIYLCCKYQHIWTCNEWFIGLLVLNNEIQAHVHARAGMHFSVY
jgi:hypothetical protein